MRSEEVEVKIDGIPIQDYNGFTSKTFYNNKQFGKIETDFIPKQVIRDKRKELEEALDKVEQLNASATRYDLIQKLNYKIETLNEIIGE